MTYLTDEETAVYEWVNSCPYACQSHQDEEGNIVVTVIINE